jgi:hypothetical protein
MAACLLGLALFENLALTKGLTWPAFDIQYREMAAAQTLLDQGFGPDAAYLGESIWYNPLSSWIAAALSFASGRGPREVVPRIGPWVNLLAPVAFFALVTLLVDGWTALCALAAFLFVTANSFPFWQAASYSPWFAPENYAQGLLYLCLLGATVASRRERSLVAHAAVGLCLGFTFLAHTAPALVAGVVLVLLALDRVRHGEGQAAAGQLAVALAAALAVSYPLVVHVVGRYHLRMVNHFPSQAPETLLDLNERAALLAALAKHSPLVLAVLALPGHLWRRRQSPEGRVLLAWTLAVLMFLAYGDLKGVALKFGLTLPSVVPTFHFLFHSMTLVSVGFGVAVMALARRLSRLARDRAGLTARPEAFAVALTLLVLLFTREAHVRRPDASVVRQQALDLASAIPADAVAWIRAHTPNDAVFLSTDEVSLYVVSPAGRKVVCTNRYFSSPYVDWARREQDRHRLFALLRDGDLERFDRLAETYDVDYVVASDGLPSLLRRLAGVSPGEPPPLTRADLAGVGGFEMLFAGETLAVYRRRPGPSSHRGSHGGRYHWAGCWTQASPSPARWEARGLSYSVRRADTASDHEAVVSFQTRELGGGMRGQGYRWFHDENPGGDGASFLLEAAGSGGGREIVGCAGIGGRTFNRNSSTWLGAALVGLLVEARHRTLLPAMTLERAVTDHARAAFHFAYGFPNDVAAGVFRRLGLRDIGELSRYVCILRFAPFLQRGGRRGAAVRLGADLLDQASRAMEFVTTIRTRTRARMEWTSTIGPQFDRLWLRSRPAGTMIGERSGGFLRWRFLRRPARIAVLKASGSAQIAAYAALVPRADGVVRVEDFLAECPSALDELLSLLVPDLRRQGYVAIEAYFFGQHDVIAALRSHGFRRRGGSRVVLADGLAPPETMDPLADPEHWYLTKVDDEPDTVDTGVTDDSSTSRRESCEPRY